MAENTTSQLLADGDDLIQDPAATRDLTAEAERALEVARKSLTRVVTPAVFEAALATAFAVEKSARQHCDAVSAAMLCGNVRASGTCYVDFESGSRAH